jgi:hypothetical protein
VLSNLQLTVVSWRRSFNDPVAEWGHLLAYLPQLKRRIERRQPRVLLLPPPQLSRSNEVNPREALGQYATQQGRAAQEIGLSSLIRGSVMSPGGRGVGGGSRLGPTPANGSP